jgi:predicted phage gp36 major capsid-like protein
MDRNIELMKEAHAKGQAIILKAAAETKGVLSKEQEAEVDKFFDEAEGHKKNADRIKKAADLKAAIEETMAPIRKHPMGHDAALDELRVEHRNTYVDQAVALGLMVRESAKKSAMHKDFVRGYLGQTDLSIAYAREALAKGIIDAEFKDLSTLTDTEGGAIVDQDFRAQLIVKLRNQVMIRQKATVIATVAGQIGFPVFDPADTDTDAPISTPNAAASVSNPTNLFGKIDENDFLNGSGVTRPLGILQANGIPAANIAGSTTAIVPEDFIDLIYAMRAVYRRNGSWMLHRKVIAALRKFRTNVGGAGTGGFIWQPSLVAGQPDMIMGYPVMESEFMPDSYAGASGDPMALFGDFSWYWIIDRTDLMVLRLNELYAANDQIGVLLRRRTDGAPVMAEAFIRLNRK